MRARHLAAAVALLLTSACAQQKTMYHWDGYDERLYRHYRSPQEQAEWVGGMGEVVAAAEQQGRRVPPGIYAEYGYALLEQGDAAAAIPWFEKERALWPESSSFMEKMIQNARRVEAGRKPPASNAAAAPGAGDQR